MKKIMSLLLVAFFSLILAQSVHADELDDYVENLDESKTEIIYQDEDITVTSFGDDAEIADMIENSPGAVTEDYNFVSTPGEFITMGSVVKDGPGGRATLNSSDTRRAIYWSVTPKTK